MGARPESGDAPWGHTPWGRGDGGAAVVLGEVARRLAVRDLLAMTGVCRAWRHAATQPHVWRHVLAAQHQLPEPWLRAMANIATELGERWSWRQEATLAAAGWSRGEGLRPEPGVTLAHAALTDDGSLLAIAAEDASVSVWESSEGRWEARGRCSLRDLGWASAARVEWAPDKSQLLVAGPLALAPRWELAVLATGGLAVLARGACGAGGAATWLPGGALVTVELRRAGPRLATTAVWLYAAHQETQSEHAGVAAPVLRIYNEGRTHFTHAVVAEDRWSAESPATPSEDPHTRYYRVTQTGAFTDCDPENDCPLLVLAGGAASSPGGATALSAWPLPSCRPPPLVSPPTGELLARHQRRAAALQHPPRQESPPPDEPTLRALCTPPSACTDLGTRVCGLAVHPGGRCVWAALEDGRMVSVGLPDLVVLRVLGGGGGGAGPAGQPYLQPAAATLLLACPLVEGGVRLWCARSGAECVGPVLGGGGPVLGALLLLGARGRRLLLLRGDRVQEWHSRAPLLSEH